MYHEKGLSPDVSARHPSSKQASRNVAVRIREEGPGPAGGSKDRVPTCSNARVRTRASVSYQAKWLGSQPRRHRVVSSVAQLPDSEGLIVQSEAGGDR